MNITHLTTHRGPTSGDRKGTHGGVVHTTEGFEAGDLIALTSGVSIHRYIPRRAGICFDMLDLADVAWHIGWGRLKATDPWTSGWNDFWFGWEIGHRRGEAWPPEQLARSLHLIRKDCRALGITRLLRHMDFAGDRPNYITSGGRTYRTGGIRSDPTDFPFWDAFAALCLRNPYPVRGEPDIKIDPWITSLKPILSQSDAIEAYQRVTRRGFRPGPLLALIGHESSFGTAGIATHTHNWGNVRTPMRPERTTGTPYTSADGFLWPVYTSWLESLSDVMDRLDQKSAYRGLDDLTEIRCIWAPVGDGANNPFAGSLTMLKMIERWQAQQPAGPDYVALWGDQADYTAEWGIPTLWRSLIDQGRNPGAVHAPEIVIAGVTVQPFENCIITYTPEVGARDFWPRI